MPLTSSFPLKRNPEASPLRLELPVGSLVLHDRFSNAIEKYITKYPCFVSEYGY